MAEYDVKTVDTGRRNIVRVHMKRQGFEWSFDIGSYWDVDHHMELVDADDFQSTELSGTKLIPPTHKTMRGEGIVVDIPEEFANRIRRKVRDNLREKTH